MNKIYLVIGYHGEYSDYTEWFVTAYKTLQQAEEHAELANKEYNATKDRNSSLLENNPDEYFGPKNDYYEDNKHKYDNKITSSGYKTSYGVEEVTLSEDILEFLRNNIYAK